MIAIRNMFLSTKAMINLFDIFPFFLSILLFYDMCCYI